MENNYTHIIKNLTLIDIAGLYDEALCDFNRFIYDLKLTDKDKDKLIAHFFYSRLLKIYSQKTNYNFLIFFTDGTKVSNEKIFNKLFRYIKNKLCFPTVTSILKIDDYLPLLYGNSPLYDDIVNQNFSLSDKCDVLKLYMKKSGLSSLYYEINGSSFKFLGI